MTEARAISDGVDLKELIEAAKKATPGPWRLNGQEISAPSKPSLSVAYAGKGWCAGIDGSYSISAEEAKANATFIALANPSTVAAMAEELVLLRAVADEARFLIDRLHEFENGWDDDGEALYREFGGHVSPSISRLKGIMPSLQDTTHAK